MEPLADMSLTGRKVDGPTAELVELQPDDGPLVTAIQLDPAYRGDPVIERSIELASSFMAFPMVTGLVEMSAWHPKEGLLLYPTGTSRSVAEILRTYRKAGNTVGVRAAIELCYLGGMILGEAAETGAAQGVFSHGDLNPWRVLVRPDGELQIIGYGLPSPEVLAFRSDDSLPTSADTWRYAPPERVAGAAEDEQADIASLCLIAAEMILGDPLLDGTSAEIRAELEKGSLPSIVGKSSRKMGKAVSEVLAYALNFDPRNRFESAEAFVSACEGLLESGLKGDSLAEAGQAVATARRGKSLSSVDDTQALHIAGRAIRPRGHKAVQQAIERASETESEGRWESRKGRSTAKADEPEKAAEDDASKRPRRRNETPEVKPEDDKTARPRRRPPSADSSDDTPEDDTPKRPRRRQPADDTAKDDAPRRPRRRGSKSADEPEDKPADKPADESSTDSTTDSDDATSERPKKRPKRRSKKSDDSETKRPRRRTRKTED